MKLRTFLGNGGGDPVTLPRTASGVSRAITMLTSVILCLEIPVISDKLRFHNVSVYLLFPRTPAVAHSRFPRGRSPTYYLAKYSWKLHENKEILAKRGAFQICLCRSPPHTHSPEKLVMYLFSSLSQIESAWTSVWTDENWHETLIGEQ